MITPQYQFPDPLLVPSFVLVETDLFTSAQLFPLIPKQSDIYPQPPFLFCITLFVLTLTTRPGMTTEQTDLGSHLTSLSPSLLPLPSKQSSQSNTSLLSPGVRYCP